MKTSDFDYELPPELIAQRPAASRDGSRLLVLDRASGAIRHMAFRDLPGLLLAGDLLVVNDTRVIPARLFGTALADREIEILLLREEPAVAPERIWSALARPARALHPGSQLTFVDPSYAALVVGTGERGMRHISFRPTRPDAPPFEAWLSRIGHVPLPPYIERADEPEDRERYQTIFAREAGSVAAPTAGLHFTGETVASMHARGIGTATVTLHVGAGTFRPVATENPADHVLDPEPYRVPPETAAAIRSNPARIIAVGTTSVRSLESWALENRPDDGGWRETGLFILPPFEFRVVTALITNFHLPRSGLLMLVSAFAGRDHVLAAYREAVRESYRFYSYGDAMLVI
ncbi:MAG: tRNA preQ1(34) S-adenosylmethionine ribosyltransferase-isomerase QueA [Candidatus Eisenbacteria bacterium]|uniref:S-adenosylmethionine:tRNA ribosyltransferase-isomerase n=1 Tax=Eiseniibacteriota bacterium TaxID=2212470 RepID=A0A538TI79_UNCEI|nr:MAG: tRNA preQ1(34) S-adenosylmethionine ribosyltransferase-isomerase QueA [Candidatus Eisenbacteria bacterium]